MSDSSGIDAIFDSAIDASTDNSIADTSDAPLGPCNLDKPFQTVGPLNSVNTGFAEDQIALTPDELTVVFSSARPVADGGFAGYNLYTATRASRTGDFGPASLLANVNSDANDREPVLSADGRTLFFASDRTPAPSDGGGLDIYVATRPNLLADFGVPGSLAGVNSPAREDPLSLSPDGKFLYFDSTKDTGAFSTYSKSLTTGDPPLPFSDLGEAGNVGGAWFTGDGLTIYFGSARTNPNPDAGIGTDYNIWTAHRANTTSSWTGFTRVDEINSVGLDVPTWVSPDGCTLYVTSDRNNASLSYDIWVARKPAN